MKKATNSIFIVLLLVFFNALNAGIYTFIPLPIGFCSYMLLFLFICFFIAENNFNLKKFIIPFIIAFFWLTILLLWKHKGTFFGLYSWFLGVLICFAFCFIDEKKSYFSLFLLLGLIFSLLFSYFEIFTGFHLPQSRFVVDSISSKTHIGLHVPTFYFTNENDFVAFLVLLFCYVRLQFKKKKVLLDLLILPLVFFIIYIANARLCLLSLMVYYLYFLFMRINKKKRYCLFFLVGAIFIYVFIKIIIPYLINLNNMQSSKSIIIRVNLLILSLKNIFVEKNFLGLGPASFSTIVNDTSRTNTIVDPHNWFMELGVEAGLLFLVIYFLFIVKYFIYEKDKYFCALFIVFLICNSCSSRFSGILWNWFFLAMFVKRFFQIRCHRFNIKKNINKYSNIY